MNREEEAELETLQAQWRESPKTMPGYKIRRMEQLATFAGDERRAKPTGGPANDYDRPIPRDYNPDFDGPVDLDPWAKYRNQEDK